MIGEDRSALAHGFGGNGALVGMDSDADETVGHLAVGSLSDQFVGRVAAPEVNAGDLKEFARGLTEQLNEIVSVGPFNRRGSNTA